MDYIAQSKDYWLAQSAISINLNALGDQNRVQASVASGAAIMCYLKNNAGQVLLDYNNAHQFQTWPLSLSPTYFNTDTRKYVYCAIPRTSDVGTMAVIVFPSVMLDVYGCAEDGTQVGSEDYYYVFLQGIISEVHEVEGVWKRTWTHLVDTGSKGTDEALNDPVESDWYLFSKVSQLVTFLKPLVMDHASWFHNLRLGNSQSNLTGVATADTPDAYVDADYLVATPSYINANSLSKKHDDEADGNIHFKKDITVDQNAAVGGDINVSGNGTVQGDFSVKNIFSSLWGVISHIKSPNYTGDSMADTGFLLTSDHAGRSRLVIDEIYVRMKAIFESVEIKEKTYTGGDQIWSCAGNKIVRVDYMGNTESADHMPVMMQCRADGSPVSGGTQAEPVVSVPTPGDTYGYTTVKVPWILRNIPLLAHLKAFSKYKKVRMVLTAPAQSRSGNRSASSPIANIRRARCYFLASDGAVDVHNWWRINDLVRCQTDNLDSSTRDTHIDGETSKTGNVMWWRKAVGVSFEPVTLDDGKQYHYVDVAFDYNLEKTTPAAMATSVYEGSDIPVAGDDIVQFGNTIIEGRMNLMLMEVNGSSSVGYEPSSDAPCLKAYRGIYSFDLNKCWVGGKCCKMKLSPKTGYEFYGPNFRQVTEYDVVPVPVDRGLWTNICRKKNSSGEYINEWEFEKDDFGRTVEYSDDDVTGRTTGVRKCYYYDKVSHGGQYWLCSIVDGAHWVDANGDYISDAAYDALTDEQKALCARHPNYTIEEPSADSNDWTLVVEKGEKGDQGDSALIIDIDNDNDQFGVDADGKVLVQQMRSTVVSMLYGTQEQAFSAAPTATMKYDDGTSVASSVAEVAVAVVQNTDNKEYRVTVTIKATGANTPVFTASGKNGLYVDIEGTCAKGTKSIRFSLEKVMSGEAAIIYQLAPKQKSFSFGRDGSNNLTPSSRSSQINVARTDGNTTTILSTAQTGITYKWGWDESTTAQATGRAIGTSISVSNTDAASHNQVWVELSTGDRETLPITKDGPKGDPGTSVIIRSHATTTDILDPEWEENQVEGIILLSNDTYDIAEWDSAYETYDRYNAEIGDCYIVDEDKHLYEKQADGWHDMGKFQGDDGENGKDGWMITADPANVILTQNLVSTSTFTTAVVGFTAKKGSVNATISSIGTPTSSQFNVAKNGSSGAAAKQVLVSSPKTYTPAGSSTPEYYTEGSFTVQVNVTDPDTNSTVTFTLTVLCYANLLGKWSQVIEDGVETSVATKLGFIDPGTGVYSIQYAGTFIRGWAENTSIIEKTVRGKNIIPSEGWQDLYGNLLAKDIFNPSLQKLDAGTDDILYSPIFFLAAGTYVFSCYTADDEAEIYLYTSSGRKARPDDMSYDGYEVFSGVVSGDTYTPSGGTPLTRRYVVLSVTADCYACLNIFDSVTPLLLYRPQLEAGSTPTSWEIGAITKSSEIKQTAEEIDLGIRNGLTNTGINITTGKVAVEADNFTVGKDGTQVLGVDATTGVTTLQDVDVKGSLVFHKTKIDTNNSYIKNYQFYNEQGNPVSDSYSGTIASCKIPYDTIVIGGKKRISSYTDPIENVVVDEGFRVILPPAKFFVGMRIRIINCTIASGHQAASLSPSRLDIGVVYREDLDEIYTDGDISYAFNFVASACPFTVDDHSANVPTIHTFVGAPDNSTIVNLPNLGPSDKRNYAYMVGDITNSPVRYRSIELVSQENPYTSSGYAWIIIDAQQ